MSASAQTKPARRPTRLRPEPEPGVRLVSSDPELFDTRIDFYFGVLDSMCGLHGAEPAGNEKQSGATQAIAQERVRAPQPGSETTAWMHVSGRKLSSQATDTITDEQLDGYAFGRRVWSALTQLPWGAQDLLRRYYSSARSLAAVATGSLEYPGFGDRLVEAEIRAAHRAFLAVMSAAESPVTSDQDVGGDATGLAQYRERGAMPRTPAERQGHKRAREDYEHDGAGLVRRYDREDSAARVAAKDAEPLLRGLQAGRNRFPPKEYEALARYLIEQPEQQRAAIKRGRFMGANGGVEVVRDDAMRGELLTLREYARRSGLARTTVMRKVVHLGLACVKVGQENRYDSDQLDRALCKPRKS